MNTITGFVLAAVLSVATPASAITVDTDAHASGSHSDSHSGAAIDVSVTTQASGAETSTTSSHDETSADVSVDSDGSTIMIDADSIDDTAITVTSSGAVSSKSDLTMYAKSVVKSSADVRDVTLSDTEVSVSHREHARIFGIFPAKVFARAYVKNDGSVTVKFPWYAFAAQKKAALESKVRASVNSAIPHVSADANAHAKLSSQTQAEVLEKAVATMKAEFEADANAGAKVN